MRPSAHVTSGLARISGLPRASGLRPRWPVLAAAALLLAALGVAAAAEAAVPPPPAGWSQVFLDDFNGAAGSRVNTGNWRYTTGTSYPGGPANFGTGEVETMTDSTANVSLDGAGNLRITPQRDGAGRWTSGRIETQRSDFQPPAGGTLRVQARIQQPNVIGAGALGYWPGFWMLGAPYRGNLWNWPGVGEMDIMENVNGRDRNHATLHCGTSPGGECGEKVGIGTNIACPGSSCTGNFHTYTLEWDRSVNPQQLRFYVDGFLFHTVAQTRVSPGVWDAATNHGFFIILNMAMGGEFHRSRRPARPPCSGPVARTGAPVPARCRRSAPARSPQGCPARRRRPARSTVDARTSTPAGPPDRRRAGSARRARRPSHARRSGAGRRWRSPPPRAPPPGRGRPWSRSRRAAAPASAAAGTPRAAARRGPAGRCAPSRGRRRSPRPRRGCRSAAACRTPARWRRPRPGRRPGARAGSAGAPGWRTRRRGAPPRPPRTRPSAPGRAAVQGRAGAAGASRSPQLLPRRQPYPARPGVRRHRLATGRPHLAERHRIGGRTNQHPAALDLHGARLQRRPAGPRRPAGDRRDRAELEPLAAEQRPSARGRRASADPPVHRERRVAPAHLGVLDGQLRRQGHALVRLRHGRGGTGLDPVQHRNQQPRARDGQPVQQVACGVPGTDGRGERPVHRAGVQPGFEQEHAGTGQLVAVQHSVLDGRGAPPGGQQREVQVDPAMARDRQRGLRHQRAVGHYRHAVRGEGAQPVEKRRLPRPDRGQHLDAALVGPGAHRRADQPPAAASGRVRPGQDRQQLVRRGRDRVQGRQGDGRRTGEDQPHQPNTLGACGLTLTTGGFAGSYHSVARMAFMASLRRAGSSRSMKSTPSRWSVSCWTQRAIVPVPTIWTGSPWALNPRATTLSCRLVSTYTPGIDRQPSGPSCSSSSGNSSTGLTRWPTTSSTSNANTRRPTPSCGAARPAPLWLCMVSMRSSTSWRSSLSKSTTGWAGLRSTGSPNRRIGWTVMGSKSTAHGLTTDRADRSGPAPGWALSARCVPPSRRAGRRRARRLRSAAPAAARARSRPRRRVRAARPARAGARPRPARQRHQVRR